MIIRDTLGISLAKNTVKVDIDNAQATLNEMMLLAEQCRQQKKAAQMLSDSLQGCWQGQSGDAVQAYLTAWMKQQEQTASNIETMVANIRKKIQAVVDADQGLARLIRNS